MYIYLRDILETDMIWFWVFFSCIVCNPVVTEEGSKITRILSTAVCFYHSLRFPLLLYVSC